jgi:hypothetical protein
MSGLSYGRGKHRNLILLTALSVLLILNLALVSVFADDDKLGNKIDVGVSLNGTPISHTDTIWAGVPATFDIYFENADTLGGYSTGYVIYSPDGAAWEWEEEILDYKLISSSPLKMDTIYSIVTTVKGSRQHPPSVILDNGGLQVYLADTNGTPRDAMLFGGTRKVRGVSPGPLEKAVQLHFVAGGVVGDKVATICIDTAKVGPVGEFIFVDIAGMTLVPEVLLPTKGRCWTVANAPKKK